MKVLNKNIRGMEGEISILAETLDDLWHLKYIIEKNDLVFSFTKRKADSSTDKLRPEKTEKKTVRLGVRVENLEFHKFANRLRVHGVIEQGMDTGFHHTLNIETGTELSIIKVWKKDQLERIDEAEIASLKPSVIIVAIEEGDADIGFVRHYGIDIYSHINQSLGKGEGNMRNVFFQEVLDQLTHAISGNESIVLAGPGFTKEDFFKYISPKQPEFISKLIMEDTASIGISGFQEVLRRGAVDRIVERSRLTQESKLIEELLKEISINGKAAYGFDEVKMAVEYGAVDTLLICDELLREEREKGDIDAFLKNVEQSQGKIVVFSTFFEPGQKLSALGSIGALLRFKI